MSDPVTHAEIEDVLSSIRRLVSDDNRSQPAAPEPAARLVLTPALRVQEPEDLDQDDAPAEQPEPETGSGAAAGSVPEAAEAGFAGDSEETAEQSSPVDGEAEETARAEAALEAEPPIAFRHRSADQLEETAGPEDAGQEEGSAPDVPVQEPEQDPAAADAPWSDPQATLYGAAADAAQLKGSSSGAEAAEAEPEENAATAGARAASVVRKIAELEARSGGAGNTARQHWEPDSQTEAPFAGTGADTIEWRDEPLSARRMAPSEAPGINESPADGAAASGPGGAAGESPESAETVVEAAFTGAALEAMAEAGDTYLDEDSLRDLVASIVREELQGPLGERITRNVRKLVRREIHRALAAHDLL
ncbi:hypothetical protein [Leisingera sp. ANG-M1]|uniref:hypothetical protein n=1 Tax=Leisingera sp. ANG-M1 TaxID=1577895 RepID=UPI00057E0893|nr:hypothetical protein [Leisingera sp. ANG-M1]